MRPQEQELLVDQLSEELQHGIIILGNMEFVLVVEDVSVADKAEIIHLEAELHIASYNS